MNPRSTPPQPGVCRRSTDAFRSSSEYSTSSVCPTRFAGVYDRPASKTRLIELITIVAVILMTVASKLIFRLM
jgi:hypothetical protein